MAKAFLKAGKLSCSRILNVVNILGSYVNGQMKNTLYYGDNLDILKRHNVNYSAIL